MVMSKAADTNTLDPGSFSFYHNMACRKTPAKPVRIVNSFGNHLQFANSISWPGPGTIPRIYLPLSLLALN